MKNKFLKTLFAVGLSLMCVLLSSGYPLTTGSDRNSVPIWEDAGTSVLGRNFKVRYGKEVTVKGKNLKVKFDSVLEDSRCPRDVTCVWAGDAKILISVRRGSGEASKMDLHTSSQLGQTGKYQQYVIKLVALDPYPRTSAKVKPSAYIATLLITRE